jgi:hypothetical protein
MPLAMVSEDQKNWTAIVHVSKGILEKNIKHFLESDFVNSCCVEGQHWNMWKVRLTGPTIPGWEHNIPDVIHERKWWQWRL